MRPAAPEHITSPTAAVNLSRRQAKEADRVGGIELLILWPADRLGPEPPDVAIGREYEASPAVRAAAEAMVGTSCEAHGLVPVHVRVVRERRPAGLPHGLEERVHLAVVIIGRRWVHATGHHHPRVMYA